MFAGKQQYIFLRLWLQKACPCVNGRSYIHVHTKALIGLSRLKKKERENMKLREKWWWFVEMGVGGGYNQNTLYLCMKF